MDTPWGWSEQQVRDLFISRVEAEMEVVEDFDFGSIDMVISIIESNLVFAQPNLFYC